MAKITLDAYLIRIREKYKRAKKSIPFNNYFDSRVLINDFASYLTKYKNNWSNISTLERSFKVESFYQNSPWLDGYIQTGEYGVGGSIIDITKGKEAYKKKTTDADTIPHYFCFCIPDNETEGIVLVQRLGLSSIKGIVDLIFKTQFRNDYQDLIMDINPIVPTKVAKQLVENGEISELHFVNHEIPSDIASRFSGSSGARKGVIEHVIRPQDRKLLKKNGILEFLDGQRKLDDVYQYHDLPFDTLKAKIDIDGRERIIDLTKVSRFKASYDITNDVQVNSEGHPTLESIRKIARDYTDDLAYKGGIKI